MNNIYQGCQSNPTQSTIQSNRSIFGQSTIQGRTIDYLVHNPIEIINPSYIIDFFGFFWIVFGLIIRVLRLICVCIFDIPPWKLQ